MRTPKTLWPGFTAEFMQDSPVFKDLAFDRTSALLQALGATVQSYARNATIIEQGSCTSSIPVVLKGRVRGVVPQARGEQLVVEIEAGESFGEALPVSLGQSPVRVYAAVATDVLAIPFDPLMADQSDAGRLLQANIKAQADKKMGRLAWLIGVLGCQDARTRVLAYLRGLPDQGAGWRVLSTNRTNLAAILRIDASTLSRMFDSLEQEGLIRVDGSKVWVSA